MKMFLCLALAAIATGVARADWTDLRPGMDTRAAWRCVGAPMMQTNGRATQQWNYDRGGYILFDRGRVIYWERSKDTQLPASIAKKSVPRPPKAKTGVLASVP